MIFIKKFAIAPKICDRITNASYYKLSIANLLPNLDKVVYIDVDLVKKLITILLLCIMQEVQNHGSIIIYFLHMNGCYII